jgi:HAD superfamily hydrolase (TIGR01458 family)
MSRPRDGTAAQVGRAQAGPAATGRTQAGRAGTGPVGTGPVGTGPAGTGRTRVTVGGAARGSAPDLGDPPAQLKARLAGVRALLLDMDGVVVLRGSPLPGAAEAVNALVARGIPFRFLTNSSIWSRDTLARKLTASGIAVGPSEIVTALSASAALAARRWPGEPLYVLAAPDALREFEGQRLLSHEEAAAPDARVAAVIVGDAGEGFTYARLNTAFRLVLRGARLVDMHRNRWWLTPEGITLDSGAFVRALEFAAGRRALLVGKPSPAFFAAALDSLAADRELARSAVLMVGDDLQSDIAGAKQSGLRAAFVLTGKHGPLELAAARRRGGTAVPDLVAAALSAVVAALD